MTRVTVLFSRVIAQGLVFAVRAYQLALSPHLGGQCRYEPGCSEYAVGALERHGPVRGAALAGRRILRCHPFQPGGFDPVPPIGRAAVQPRSSRAIFDKAANGERLGS